MGCDARRDNPAPFPELFLGRDTEVIAIDCKNLGCQRAPPAARLREPRAREGERDDHPRSAVRGTFVSTSINRAVYDDGAGSLQGLGARLNLLAERHG